MARPKKTDSGPTPVDAITHDDNRVNIPTADAQDFVDEAGRAPTQLRYPRDTTLDPQLVWTGKDEQDSEDLVVEAPPLHIRRRSTPVRWWRTCAAPRAERPEDEPELSLFDSFDGLDGGETVEFYKHASNWSNRLILGDSLQVMGSLAERENLRGQSRRASGRSPRRCCGTPSASRSTMGSTAIALGAGPVRRP